MLRKTLFALTAATALAGTAVFAGSSAAKKDIVDTAVSAGTFETLVAAVSAAEADQSIGYQIIFLHRKPPRVLSASAPAALGR